MKKATDLSSFRNDEYRATIGGSKLKQICWYFINVLFFINPLNPLIGLKIRILRWFGASIGNGVVIKPGVNIKYPWKLKIGDHSWIGENVWIDNLSDVIIGSNTTISQGALLLTGSHDLTKVAFDMTTFPIILEDGVWIGAKAVVFGGVTCRSHSVLGINSVAEADLNSYLIYKGNPAIPVLTRRIK